MAPLTTPRTETGHPRRLVTFGELVASFDTVGSQAAQRHSHMVFAQQNHVRDEDCTISERTMCNKEGLRGRRGRVPRPKSANYWSLSSPSLLGCRARSLPSTLAVHTARGHHRYRDIPQCDDSLNAASSVGLPCRDGPVNASCVGLPFRDHCRQDVVNSCSVCSAPPRTVRSFSGSLSDLGDPLLHLSLPRVPPRPLRVPVTTGTPSSETDILELPSDAIEIFDIAHVKPPRVTPLTVPKDVRSVIPFDNISSSCEFNLSKLVQDAPLTLSLQWPLPTHPKGNISALTKSREVQLVDAPFPHVNSNICSRKPETKRHRDKFSQDSVNPRCASFVRLNAFLLRSHTTSVISGLAEDGWIDASERNAFCQRFSSWPSTFLQAYARFVQRTDVGEFVADLRASNPRT